MNIFKRNRDMIRLTSAQRSRVKELEAERQKAVEKVHELEKDIGIYMNSIIDAKGKQGEEYKFDYGSMSIIRKGSVHDKMIRNKPEKVEAELK